MGMPYQERRVAGTMGNTGGMHAPTEFWVERIDKLQAQRDKLLAACKEAVEVIRTSARFERFADLAATLTAAIQEAEDTP